MERAVLTVEEGRVGADITFGGGNIVPFCTLSLSQQAEETVILPGHRRRLLIVLFVGPVNLTEVVREAHLEIHTPIDFDEAIAYSSPDLPGQVVSLARVSTGDEAAVRPAAFVTESGLAGGPSAPAPAPDVSNRTSESPPRWVFSKDPASA